MMFHLIKQGNAVATSKIVASNSWYTQMLKVMKAYQELEPGYKYVIVREVTRDVNQ